MPDADATAPDPSDDQATPKAAQPDDTDWKSEARKWEQRAKANAAAEQRLAELENANKTEAQKLADDLTDARKQAATATEQLLRYEVAAELEVPPKLVRFLTGATRDEVEESARALLEAIPPGGAAPPRAPAEATTPVANGNKSAPADGNEWLRGMAAKR